MDTPSRKSTEAQQLPHSGDLGLEQPQVHYDKTTLPEAFEKHLTDTGGNVIVPDTLAGVAPESEAPKKSRKKLFIGLGAGATAAAAGVALVAGLMVPKGDGNNTPPETDPSATSQPSNNPEDEGNDPETNGVYSNPNIERIINNPNRVSPQDIAAMSPEELKDFATISYEEAPSPEDYAPQFVTIYDAWMNSGLTEEEFKPYDASGKNVYEQAMADKYDGVFIDGLFGISDLDGLRAVHSSALNNYNVGYGLTDIDYSVGAAYKDVEVISDSGTSNGFKIVVNMEIASNEEEAGVTQIAPGEKDVYEDLSLELTVGSIDGNYKIMAIENVTE